MKTLTPPKKRVRKATHGGAREGAGRPFKANPEELKKPFTIVLRPTIKDAIVAKYGGLTAALELTLTDKAKFRDKIKEGTLEKDGRKQTYNAYLRVAQKMLIEKRYGSLTEAVLKLK